MFRYHNQALPLIYYGHTLLGLRKQFFFSLKQLMKRFIGEPQTIKLREIHARFYDSIDIDECAISAHNCHGVDCWLNLHPIFILFSHLFQVNIFKCIRFS